MKKSDLKNNTVQYRGLISWMTRNRVTPNIMMLVFILGGLFVATKIKQEVFPAFDLDIVTIRMAYPGSSPEEVEQGIILAIEEGIRGLDGIKEVTATAGEGSANVTAELLEDADSQKVYQDIKQQIDRITTFPEDAEEPEVSLAVHRHEVLQIQLYGQVSEWILRELAEQVRDRLLQNPEITQVDLYGAREYEIHIEVPQDILRTYGLTLDDIASKIKSTSVEIPGGFIETKGGDILLRVKQRRDWAHEFAQIPIVATAEGTILYLSNIATVTDDFEETDRFATYNGDNSIGIAVYRVGKQTPIGVSDAAKEAMKEIEKDLPSGVKWAVSRDRSEMYRQRLGLLLKNAFFGLVLVLILLTLFLEYKLAFWVTLGIPTSFLGAFLFLPAIDITINMMSMFAFIIALGIVVDDAIVAGENIYEYRNRGIGLIKAAILGARDVAIPVSFSILTNIIAFLPLCFVPGTIGKIFKTIPFVVITVFSISWIESLLILPAHLAHSDSKNRSALGAFLHERQQKFSQKFTRFIEESYGPFLDKCIEYRYLTLAFGVVVFFVILGYVFSGRIGIILMPRIESDRSVVTAILPYGSAFEKASKVSDKLVQAADEVANRNGGDKLADGIFALIEENKVEVTVYLTDPDIRPISTAELTKQWRDAVGQITGLESLKFESDRGGPGSGATLTVELNHRDIDVLDRASAELADILSEFPNVKDIDDGYTPGKQQLNFTIKPEGESLGLTAYEVARQVRNAFYGAEALRQQRGRNEIKVKVRLPKNDRVSEYDLERLLIRTPSGSDVPLMQIADVKRGRAYTVINRRNARRTVTVTADVDPIDETSLVQATLDSEILPKLLQDYPGLSYGYEGRQADFSESMQKLIAGFILALLGIFVLLAIPFGSYSQPLIVMVAVPFGIIGAILGHMIMGYSLSVMSMMGIIALSGVVVNDSLILIDYSNRLKRQGSSSFQAIHLAGIRRFRPIILTSLTTFGGLAPMIFETSRQARFMIPMALSLGYGILFSTAITLILVPSLSMILEDIHLAIISLKNSISNKLILPSA
ncbi:MAG: efflux RND transporter permease subunit [Sedimentisphaerales bacterium]|nr:efflux RND transporter permease subunit [Sedimentisphaerales bacterium]